MEKRSVFRRSGEGVVLVVADDTVLLLGELLEELEAKSIMELLASISVALERNGFKREMGGGVLFTVVLPWPLLPLPLWPLVLLWVLLAVRCLR